MNEFDQLCNDLLSFLLRCYRLLIAYTWFLSRMGEIELFSLYQRVRRNSVFGAKMIRIYGKYSLVRLYALTLSFIARVGLFLLRD